MLLFKAKFLPLIRSGQKTQTLRFWTHAHVKPNQITHTPGLGKLLITAVDLIPSLDHLTPADALADGFPSLPALLAELTRIYGPDIPPGKKLFRLRFTFPAHEQNNPAPAISAKKSATKKAQTIPAPQTRAAKTKPAKKSLKPSARRQQPMTPTQRRALRKYLAAHSPKNFARQKKPAADTADARR